jgi:hypothetical protein
MPMSTRATLALNKVGVNFTLHSYDYDPAAERIGLQAAEGIGVEPRRVLKTLMAEVDGKPVCAIVPSDREVSMKKLAAAIRPQPNGIYEALIRFQKFVCVAHALLELRRPTRKVQRMGRDTTAGFPSAFRSAASGRCSLAAPGSR